jgi:hypothetical protein
MPAYILIANSFSVSKFPTQLPCVHALISEQMRERHVDSHWAKSTYGKMIEYPSGKLKHVRQTMCSPNRFRGVARRGRARRAVIPNYESLGGLTASLDQLRRTGISVYAVCGKVRKTSNNEAEITEKRSRKRIFLSEIAMTLILSLSYKTTNNENRLRLSSLSILNFKTIQLTLPLICPSCSAC